MNKGFNTKTGFKNFIINGGFDIWQRGESFTGMSGWNYTADRWKVYGISDVSKESDGRLYALSSNDDTDHAISTILGNVDRLLGKEVTFSIDVEWLQGDDNNLKIAWRDSSLTWIDSAYLRFDNIMSINERKTISITTTIPYNTNIKYLDFRISNHTDTDVIEVKLKDAQVEIGDYATAFEQRPLGLELSLCHRYYQKGSTHTPLAFITDTTLEGTHSIVPNMRVSPTITLANHSYYIKSASHTDGTITTNGNSKSTFIPRIDDVSSQDEGISGILSYDYELDAEI